MISENSRTRSRSSTSCGNWVNRSLERVGPAARPVLFLLAAAAFALVPVCALAIPSRVDMHVSSIPTSALLTTPGIGLVDAGRQAAAASLARTHAWLYFVWAGLQIVAFWYLWSSGRAAALRDSLRRRVRNEHVLRALFGGFLAVVAQIAAFPVLFTEFRLSYAAELTNQTIASWFRDFVATSAVDAVITGVMIAIILALVDATRLWYIVATALVFAFALGLMFAQPVILAPIFNTLRPLTDTDLSARLTDLAEHAGLGRPAILVADLSRQTSLPNAWVAGWGATRRIVLSDTLLTSETPGEIEFIVAHELGHYAKHDVIKLTLVATALTVLALAISVIIGDRIGFRRDDDPVSRLALVGAILGCAALLLFPVYNAYSRALEARADAYALAITSTDRADGVRSFVRDADDGLSPLCPPRAATLYFLDHPPLGQRIAALQGRPDPCP